MLFCLDPGTRWALDLESQAANVPEMIQAQPSHLRQLVNFATTDPSNDPALTPAAGGGR